MLIGCNCYAKIKRIFNNDAEITEIIASAPAALLKRCCGRAIENRLHRDTGTLFVLP